MTRSLIFLFLTAGLVAGCDEAAPPAPAASKDALARDLWNPAFVGVEGEGRVEIQHANTQTFIPLTMGQYIPPGATLRTAARTRAWFRMEGGELALDHGASVEILSTHPGMRLLEGQVIMSVSAPEQGARAARVETVHGDFTMETGRVALRADAERASASVAQGFIQTLDGQKTRALFGEALVMSKGAPMAITRAPDIAQQLAWRVREDLDDDALRVERSMGSLTGEKSERRTRGGAAEVRVLELEDHQVKVTLEGMVAYTEVTQTFHNPFMETLTGIYRFPVPSDAQVSHLAMEADGKVVTGKFMEQVRAEQLWQEMVLQEREDPALLQWKQGNQFELRIFPIEPRSSRKVTIGYVQHLTSTGQGYRYTYPMPGEGADAVRAQRFAFQADLLGYLAQEEVTLSGYPGARMERGATAQDVPTLAIKLGAQDFAPRGDLAIDFSLPAQSKDVRMFAHRDPEHPAGDAYVAITLRPQVPRQLEQVARDFVFVLDRSYGRQGAAMDLQRKLTERLLTELHPSDRFRVIACHHHCESVGARAFQDAELVHVQPVLEALTQLEASGSTYAAEAMRSAARVLDARPQEKTPRSAHIIYMTDGIASAGALNPGTLGKATERVLQESGAQMSVVSLGGEQDMANMQAMARAARGQVVSVSGDQALTTSALKILRYHYGVALRELAVELPAGLEQVHPAQPPSLFAGEELTLVARMKGDTLSGEVKLRGLSGEQVFNQSWPVSVTAGPQNRFVPRLWAQLRIEDLERSAQPRRDEIVALSTRFGVLSRYTSLLTMEEDFALASDIEPQPAPSPELEGIPELSGGEDEHIQDEQLSARIKEPVKVPVKEPVKKEPLKKEPASAQAEREDGMDVWGFPTKKNVSDRDTVTKKAAAKKPVLVPGPPTEIVSIDGFDELNIRADRKDRSKDNPLGMPSIEGSSPTRAKTGRSSGDLGNKPSRTPKLTFGEPELEEFGGLEVISKARKQRVIKKRARPSRRLKPAPAPEPTTAGTYIGQPSTRISAMTRDFVRARHKALRKDPRDLGKRIELLSTLMTAATHHADTTRRALSEWLDRDPLSSHAVFLSAQLALVRAQLQEARLWLNALADTSARATWIHATLMSAHTHDQNSALACAHATSLKDLDPKQTSPSDILACPASTREALLFDVDEQREPTAAPATEEPLTAGEVLISATWQEEGDIDLLVIDPTGEVISWLTNPGDARMTNVRRIGSEQLTLSKLVAGHYQIIAARSDMGDDSVEVSLTVTHGSQRRTFSERISPYRAKEMATLTHLLPAKP